MIDEINKPTATVAPIPAAPIDAESFSDEAKAAEQAGKSWSSVAALALFNLKWVLIGAAVIIAMTGIFWSGWSCSKGTITKTVPELPKK